ncbi:MAG: Asp-tRNA(Asn)/Glu-tRNA(Gln) amidotransferase subunit GatC [Oscillospiraceae bacterium]|nr:Asp-tRNA(Asn)/Glu-tRNA(Gln) amidotransferase subunit GatC [Oscillospiraceae bacterium]
MTNNSNIDIKHVAKLARIKISDDELPKYSEEMNNIIKMVEAMPEIDDELLVDESGVMDLREDKLADSKISRDEILKNAPKVVAGCVVVPKTVE